MNLIPIERSSLLSGRAERLCPYCVNYSGNAMSLCEYCQNPLKPYEASEFFKLRFSHLKKSGYKIESSGMGLNSESQNDIIENAFQNHVKKFHILLEEAEHLESLSYQPVWFEHTALVVLRDFPFTQLDPGAIANYLPSKSEGIDRWKSIAYGSPLQEHVWLASLALLRACEVMDFAFFTNTLVYYKIFKPGVFASGEKHKWNFNDALINEFSFTLFHWSVMASKNHMRFVNSLDKSLMNDALSNWSPIQPIYQAQKGLMLTFIEEEIDPEIKEAMRNMVLHTPDYAMSLEFLKSKSLVLPAEDLTDGEGWLSLIPHVKIENSLSKLKMISEDKLAKLIPFVSFSAEDNMFSPLMERFKTVTNKDILASMTKALIKRGRELTNFEFDEFVEILVGIKASELLKEVIREEKFNPSEKVWGHLKSVFMQNKDLLNEVLKYPDKFKNLSALPLEDFFKSSPDFELLQQIFRSPVSKTYAFRDSFMDWFCTHHQELAEKDLALVTNFFMSALIYKEDTSLNRILSILELLQNPNLSNKSFFNKWVDDCCDQWRKTFTDWPFPPEEKIGMSDFITRILIKKINPTVETALAALLFHLKPGFEFFNQFGEELKSLSKGAGSNANYWYHEILSLMPVVEVQSVESLQSQNKAAALASNEALENMKKEMEELKRQQEVLKLQNEIMTITLWFQTEMARIQALSIEPMQKGQQLADLSEEFQRRVTVAQTK